MDLRTPYLKLDIMLESNPLESRILVPRLARAPTPGLLAYGYYY